MSLDLPQVRHLPGCDIGGGEVVKTQEISQGGGVDSVSLDPRPGDEVCLEGVGQRDFDNHHLEQLEEGLPTATGRQG